MANEVISNTEVESALVKLFERVSEVQSDVQSMDNRIDMVEEMARSAKTAVTNIHTVPTNGYDVFLGILGKATAVAIIGAFCWVTVKCVQAYANRTQPKIAREITTHRDNPDGSFTIDTTTEYENEK